MKLLTAMMAAALTLCLAGTALAGPLASDPVPVSPVVSATQDLRAPDHTVAGAASAQLDLRAPDQTSSSAAGVADAIAPASGAPLVSPDGGLSAFVIVLICAGGAAALAGAAYTTVRVMRRAPAA